MSTRRRQKFNRSWTTKTRRGLLGQSKGGVTTQRDSRTIYVKGRRNPRKQKTWKRFRNKVLAVSEKDLGSQTAVFNMLHPFYTTNSQNQVIAEFGLYANRSGVYDTLNDLYQIGTHIRNADSTVAKGLNVDRSARVMFQSGVLDLTIRNSTQFRTGAGYEYNSLGKLEVDVYELQITHATDGVAVYGNVEALLSTNPDRTKAIGGDAADITEVQIAKRGVTPWDCTYALSQFGIRILRKTKYTIPNGDTITYQIRDPKRHSFQLDKIGVAAETFALPMSRFVFIIAKLAPGLPVGTEIGFWQPQIHCGSTRKYMFKVENWSEDRTMYFTN